MEVPRKTKKVEVAQAGARMAEIDKKKPRMWCLGSNEKKLSF